MSIIDSAVQTMIKDLEAVRKRIERDAASRIWKRPGPKQYAQIEAKLNKDGRTGRVERKGEYIGAFALQVDKEAAKVTYTLYLTE